jgi:hypothetical protein
VESCRKYSRRLEGTRAVTALSFHPSGDGCRKWKVGRNRQPLKLSPAIPVVKVVENGRFKAPGQPLKLSPVILVVTVVENGRLEGTQGSH